MGASLSADDSLSRSRVLLQRIMNKWDHRAQVRRHEAEDPELRFDLAADDFLPELLPFREHPLFREADPELRKQALSLAWIAYNEKTIAIETEIVAPLCTFLISGRLPVAEDATVREIASETLVDEAYHVLLTVRSNAVVRSYRGLNVRLPEPHLVKSMRECQACFEEDWQRALVLLATCIVSEIFISDYLDLLSKPSAPLQRLHQQVVDAHRLDELVHSAVFRELTKCVFAQLTLREREFLFQVLPRPVRWFAARDLNVWRVMLDQIGFPKAGTIIGDCAGPGADGLNLVDYQGVVALAREIGAVDRALGRDAFAREGLRIDI